MFRLLPITFILSLPLLAVADPAPKIEILPGRVRDDPTIEVSSDSVRDMVPGANISIFITLPCPTATPSVDLAVKKEKAPDGREIYIDRGSKTKPALRLSDCDKEVMIADTVKLLAIGGPFAVDKSATIAIVTVGLTVEQALKSEMARKAGAKLRIELVDSTREDGSDNNSKQLSQPVE